MIGSPEAIFGWLNFTLDGAVKLMIIVALVMYAIFGLVVVKQVAVMTESIESDVNGVVKFLSWVHLGLAVLLVLLAVYIL